MKKHLLFCMVFLGFSYPAIAQYSGNDLLQICEAKSREVDIFCIAYLKGIMEAKEIIQHQEKFNCLYYSLPNGVTGNQIIDIIVKGLRDNPKDRHLFGAALAINYIGKAFPCPKK